METTLTDKIYNALQVYDEGSQYREVVAEVMLRDAVVFDESVPIAALEAIDEETLLNQTSKVKKAVAAARKIAQATGDAEIEEESPYEMASAADEAIERIKQTTLYAKGEIEYEELANRLIDRAEARLVVVADKAIDMAADAIPAVLARIPKLAPLAPIAKTVVERIKPAVKTVVQKGINWVADQAKKFAPKLINTAKGLLQKAKQKLMSWATA